MANNAAGGAQEEEVGDDPVAAATSPITEAAEEIVMTEGDEIVYEVIQPHANGDDDDEVRRCKLISA